MMNGGKQVVDTGLLLKCETTTKAAGNFAAHEYARTKSHYERAVAWANMTPEERLKTAPPGWTVEQFSVSVFNLEYYYAVPIARLIERYETDLRRYAAAGWLRDYRGSTPP